MLLSKLFVRFVKWVGYDLGITPNQVTVGRLIFFIPGWLVWIYKFDIADRLGVWWQLVGFFALVVVATVILFDLVDGALARETGQVSRQGKVLDPIVDKFITYSTLILFWSVIDHIALVILFSLDIISTFLRSATEDGANEFGKKKALCQNLSKFFFAMAVLLAISELNLLGNVLLWGAVVLAMLSVGVRILPVKVKTVITRFIPQLFTFGNLICGVGAIWLAAKGTIQGGVLFIYAAMVFDFIDGAVARKLGVASEFGKHFDTVADLVSFGIGPAYLACADADWALAVVAAGVLYIVATGMRLYDYEQTKDKTPKGFFRGFPSPAAAWLVASVVLWLPPLGCLFIMVTASILMCSFKVFWSHFGRILPTLTILELGSGLLIGLCLALIFTPVSFMAGPIAIYLFSPRWRKVELLSQ